MPTRPTRGVQSTRETFADHTHTRTHRRWAPSGSSDFEILPASDFVIDPSVVSPSPNVSEPLFCVKRGKLRRSLPNDDGDPLPEAVKVTAGYAERLPGLCSSPPLHPKRSCPPRHFARPPSAATRAGDLRRETWWKRTKGWWVT